LDNSTRWNSTYASLHRALKIRVRIQVFLSGHRQDLSKDYLSDDDWEQLSQIHNGLRAFHEATLRVEGNAGKGHHGSIWEALPLLEALLQAMEDGRKREVEAGRPKSPLSVAFNNAWDKLIKYYNLTDNSHGIYAAALLLHPTYQKRYFDIYWNTDDLIAWKPQMIQNVKSIWENEYKSSSVDEPVTGKEHEPDILDRYLRTPQTQATGDCFDSFINSPITEFSKEDNVIAWWNSPANPWKELLQQAFDLLSIPAMSAEIERVFNSARRLITSDRNRLNDDTIEYPEPLRYWWNHNIIAQRR
jgi:hAT family C-terminal dimerisation region